MAAAFSILVAALLWTLPLQLLHFGAMPLYALIAISGSLLLAPLTLLAMLSALLALVLPPTVLPLLLWPVHQLAGLVITMAGWIVNGLEPNCSPGAPGVGYGLVGVRRLALAAWGQRLPSALRVVSMTAALLAHGLVQLLMGWWWWSVSVAIGCWLAIVGALLW